MPTFNRRRFGQLVMGAAAALPLVAAAPALADSDSAAASPLKPAQMEQYRKTLPDTAAELKKLHGFDLGYGYEPDFVFRATGAVSARPGRKRKAVKHG